MTSLRLGHIRETIIKESGINFNDWVKRKFDEEFINEEFLKETIDKEEKKIDYKKKLLKIITNEKNKTSVREKKYLTETKVILKKFGEDSPQIDLRFKGYCSTFKKRYLKLIDFINLINLL